MQEKQLKVLEVFKEMQKQGVFTILKSGTYLDKLISDASSYEDISNDIQDIKIYIKDLEDEFASVSIGATLACFNDKFQYELHNMYLAPFNQKEKMHILETAYGKNNPFTIALKADDARFTLEERKLIKLINHYYINLKTEDRLKNKMFYIPISDLMRISKETINRKKIKESIIDACERISNKRVSWDLSKTKYATTKYKKKQNLKELKLDIGKNIKLVNITPVYTQYDKKGNLELKGIVCKTNKLLELRFELQQISYLFPTEGLRGDYLSYSITELFTYHMNLKKNKQRGYITKLVKSIADEIYYEEKGFPTYKPYWSIIKNSKHKQRKLLDLLTALANTSYYLSLNKNYKSIGYIVSNTVTIKVLNNGKQRENKAILNELSASKDKLYMKEIITFTSTLSKKKVTLDDLLLYKYPKQFDYEQLKPMKNKFIENGNVDVEKLRALLVADVRLKENVIKLINQGDIEFKIKMSEN